jgi:hypothetical protein
VTTKRVMLGTFSRVVPFVTIIQASDGGPAVPAEHVIVSDRDYDAFFNNGRRPTSIGVDFSKEVVLAVGLGERQDSRFGVEIQHIVQMTSGFTAPFSFVNYVEKVRSGPAIDVITHPIHVVKVARYATEFLFVNATSK